MCNYPAAKTSDNKMCTCEKCPTVVVGGKKGTKTQTTSMGGEPFERAAEPFARAAGAAAPPGAGGRAPHACESAAPAPVRPARPKTR